MIISNEVARERVAQGAAFLDANHPGWHNRIDVGTLTLHNACGCIAGQLSNNSFFPESSRALGIKDRSTCVSHGFDLNYGEFSNLPATKETRKASYQPLQDAWIEAIADRRLKEQMKAEETCQVSCHF